MTTTKHSKTCHSRSQAWPRIVSMRKAPLAAAVSAALMLPTGPARAEIEEVIVTATMRDTSITDVPYNISAIGAEAIANSNAGSIEDLARLVPGLAMANAGQKQALNSNFILRGVNIKNPSFNNSLLNVTDNPVSMYFGDIPLFAPIRLTDVERVEVLRGPQGTLYGSGSVGGTVRFIPKRPDTENSVADVSASVASNAHSDELNYAVDFVGNIPVSDTFALRVAAGYELQGGVVDALGAYALDTSSADPTGPSGFDAPIYAPALANPADPDSVAAIAPQEDTDEFDTLYFRGSALWAPSDGAEVVLTFMHQENNGEGDTVRGILNDDWQQGPKWAHNMRRVNDGLELETDLISLEMSGDFGFGTVTSATGFTSIDAQYQNDISGLYQFLDDLDFFAPCSPFGSYCGFPRLTTPSPQADTTDTFTQELRLVTDTGGNWDAIVGLFYRDQEMETRGRDLVPGFFEWANDPTTAASIAVGSPTVADTLQPSAEFAFELNRDINFTDLALYGELTYRLSDTWQITGGLRTFDQEFDQNLFNELHLIFGPFTAADTSIKRDFDGTLFKFNTSFSLAEDHTLYFTWAEGFRHGGANGFQDAGPFAVPEQFLTFQSEEAVNYELGLKGYLADGNVRYSTAIYQIDLDNPQRDAFLGPLALPGVVNADEAQTTGLEVEFTVQASENLTVNFGYNYTDAEFTKDSVTAAPISGDVANIAKGDPLPGVSEHMASWSGDYFIPLSNGNEVLVNLNGSYRSDFVTQANPNTGGNFANLDAFTIWNASVSWTSDRLTLGGYVRNIGDEEAVTGVRLNRGAFDDRAFVTRPRSIGVFGRFSFK